MAVKHNRLDIVRVLVDTSATQYLQRDYNGMTPLHLAIKSGYAEITRLIAKTGPAEALTLEDAVGNTPLETATHLAFLKRLDVASCPIPRPYPMPPQVEWARTPFDLAKQERELPLLRETIQSLLDEGRLLEGSKLAKDLRDFAARLETKISEVKTAKTEKAGTAKDSSEQWTAEKDNIDPIATLQVVREAITARPSHRQLVHLSDVQIAVQKGLEEFTDAERKKRRNVSWRNRRGHDEDEELDREPEAPKTSVLTCTYVEHNMFAADWHKI